MLAALFNNDMHKDFKMIKIVLSVIALLALGKISHSQDSLKVDSTRSLITWNFPVVTFKWDFSWTPNTWDMESWDYSINHYPSKEDSDLCKKYRKLIKAEPSKKNHSAYYHVAQALWELGRTEEAERMFLKIISSK